MKQLEIITLCNFHFIGDKIKMVAKEDIIEYFLQRNNKNVHLNWNGINLGEIK